MDASLHAETLFRSGKGVSAAATWCYVAQVFFLSICQLTPSYSVACISF